MDSSGSLSLTPQEVSGVRLPRRRWSRRTGSADGVLMVKSMLDLRLLDSYCPDRHEEQQEVETLKDSLNQTPLKKKKKLFFLHDVNKMLK